MFAMLHKPTGLCWGKPNRLMLTNASDAYIWKKSYNGLGTKFGSFWNNIVTSKRWSDPVFKQYADSTPANKIELEFFIYSHQSIKVRRDEFEIAGASGIRVGTKKNRFISFTLPEKQVNELFLALTGDKLQEIFDIK